MFEGQDNKIFNASILAGSRFTALRNFSQSASSGDFFSGFTLVEPSVDLLTSLHLD